MHIINLGSFKLEKMTIVNFSSGKKTIVVHAFCMHSRMFARFSKADTVRAPPWWREIKQESSLSTHPYALVELYTVL